MNINTTLSGYFKDNGLIAEPEINSEIRKFFAENNFGAKGKHAKKIIEKVIGMYYKEQLYSIIAELYKVERATLPITKKRHHFIHSCNTFLLGLCINKYYLNNKVDIFEWTLAALFHDIAYPVTISQDIIGSYLEKMSAIKKDLDIKSSFPEININPEYFEILTNNKNAFDCIQKRIDEWKLDLKVKERYEEKKLCHGMLSALTILYLIDLMYKKNACWNQDNFENHIVPACSAIFLHNLEDVVFFNTITIDTAALPYLLKLCDELQIWQRPKKGMRKGYSPENCDIKINDEMINFIVTDIKIEEDIKKKIDCLKDHDIKVN